MENQTDHSFQCSEDRLGPQSDSLYIVVPVIVIYVIIFITGTVGNISTCIVIARNKSMHTATNYYLFNLAVSDLLLLIAGLPQEIYLIYSRYPYIFGSTFCFVRGLVAEATTNATILTITAFTVERYLAICHPFLSHTMSKLTRAIKFIMAIWLVSICLAIPQAMPLTVVGPEACAQCVALKPILEHAFELSTLLFFVFPICIITVLYVLIGLKLKSSTMMKKRNVLGRGQSKGSRKVVKMLVAVVVAFFICWAPFHAQRLFSLYYTVPPGGQIQSFYLKIYEIVTYISGVLYYISATVNPILYNIMSAKFREAFKETFSWCCCRLKAQGVPRPQRSYSVLSRSAQRGPDSTDSGRDDPSVHSHTSLTQKTSLDSVHGPNSGMTRNRTLPALRSNIEEEEYDKSPADPTPILISIHISPQPSQKEGRFWQYFHCIKALDDNNKQLSAYYTTPMLEVAIPPKRKSCGSPISNSSLKDIETGALEDELTTYMKELKRRECYS